MNWDMFWLRLTLIGIMVSVFIFCAGLLYLLVFFVLPFTLGYVYG